MEQSTEITFGAGHLKKLSIPSATLVDSHVVYHIEVCLSDYSWFVHRRYREFVVLHEKLTKKYTINTKLLPPKKLVGNLHPEHIKKRKLCLETYLQEIISLLGKIPRVLQIFLEFHIYDILAVTQTLAEKLFKVGDKLLSIEAPFVLTSLQLFCISRRLKLPIPTCAGEGYLHDVGNLYDIVYCAKNVKIIEDNVHKLIGLSKEEMLLDPSVFKSIESLEVLNTDIDSLQATHHLQANLKKLHIHSSLHLLKDILIDQDVWTCGTDNIETFSNDAASSMIWFKLIEINFSHNSIPYIDESVTLLCVLEKLNLSYNEIKEIEHLQGLPNLRELDLSHNQIECVDDVNTTLGNIKILKLASNKLWRVGGTSKINSLMELDLSENFIDDVADVLALAALPCLEVLDLLGNPVRQKNMYRIQVLTAFEEKVSQICLDNTETSPAEIESVERLLADMDSFELVNATPNQSLTPTKGKAGQRKTNRKKKIKAFEPLDDSFVEEATSMPSNEIEREDEFKNKIKRIRHLGGDAWLGIFNEFQNETNLQSASLPTYSIDHKSTIKTLCTSTSEMIVNDDRPFVVSSGRSDQVRQPKSCFQFGFSAALEDLVREQMKENKDVLTGTFIVNVQVENNENDEEQVVMVEEERMVGVDLSKAVLIEIEIDTGKTFAKYKLVDGITSVDILETPNAFYVYLFDNKYKCGDSGHAPSKHVAKYKMRSMKDASELLVLLHKFIGNPFTARHPEHPGSSEADAAKNDIAATTLHTPRDHTAALSNPAGIPAVLLDRFLANTLRGRWSSESELTESGHHPADLGKEEVCLILWSSCFPYALPEHELPVCLVLTNFNIYLFQVKEDGIPHPVTSSPSYDVISSKLPLLCYLSLEQLRVLVCGLFQLGFRLEFSKRGSRGTFTFLTRDSKATESFLGALGEVTKAEIAATDLGPEGEFTSTCPFTVVQSNEEKLDRLKQEIAKSCGKAFQDDECILMYTVVREVLHMTSLDEHVTSYTRTLVVTNWHLFLCEEDHVHWPTPTYARDTPSTPQWVVTKYEAVKCIIGLEMYDVIGDHVYVGAHGMSVLYEDSKQEGRETKVWHVIFKVEEEREQLQRSLSQIWSYNFHGNLQISKSRPLSTQRIRHSSRVDVPAQFFQEIHSQASSPPDSPSRSRSGKGHRRNASGHCYPNQHDETIRKSLETLRNASVESLEKFFTDKLRAASAGHADETILCYTWTGCVAYLHPTREIHVWLILSTLKVYLVADSTDGAIIEASQNVVFGPGTQLCVTWFPVAALRQVCVGFFDQTFRLETIDPECTFTFLTRAHEVTSYFLENLNNALEETVTETPPSVSSEELPSIYDSDPNTTEADDEQSSERHGVVRFLYPNDDTIEILKHAILEFSQNSARCLKDDVSIVLYLLVFQVENGEKLSRTFLILNHALCTCLENHVNFPLPLFVKGLPMGSRYEIKHLHSLDHIKRIELSGFNTQDFIIVFAGKSRESVEDCAQDAHVAEIEDSACVEGEIRWSLIAQTYEEKEKALAMILKLCKENYGKDLPVFRI